jgi:hypothetical protein
MNNQNHLPNADLDWLAYQYVAGEMCAADYEAFEERLAADQSARQAVATAVELIAACQAGLGARPVIKPAATSPRRRTAFRLAVLSAGLAASLTIAWLGQFQGRGSDPGLADRDSIDRGSSWVGSESSGGPQLALMWADLGENLTAETAPLGDVPLEAPEANGVSNGTAASGEDNDLAAPDWLMAALSDDADPTVPDEG